MTRRRWMADEVRGDRAALTGAHAEHLCRVLRARPGQEFDIVAGSQVRLGRVLSAARDRVEFQLGEEVSNRGSVSPERCSVALALSVFKFDRMEWAIEKCTEIGVARFIPVLAQRSEAHLRAAAPKRTERWRRIALEAAEQSRRVSPPEVSDPVRLKEAIALPAGLRILLSETEREASLRTALQSGASVRDVLLAIGPEGGWTETELEEFSLAGWIPASLGETILRAETAAIAATVLAVAGLQRPAR